MCHEFTRNGEMYDLESHVCCKIHSGEGEGEGVMSVNQEYMRIIISRSKKKKKNE